MFCTKPVIDLDNANIQGKCAECLGRHHPTGAATRWLLRQASKARNVLQTERLNSRDKALPREAA